MSELVYTQPIFGAGETQTRLNIESLLSLSEYIEDQKKKGLEMPPFDVVLGGWCSEEKYWEQIISAASTFPEACNLTIKKFPRNYGKSFVINNILSKYLSSHQETKFIVTCDSDMVFLKDQDRIFQRAIIAAQLAPQFRKAKTGFIAFNQAEDNCHWVNTFDCKLPYNIKELNLSEQLAWPTNMCGIAGGALFIMREAWDAVGGYHQYPNFYGSDDGLLLREVQQKGFTASVLLTASIKHPKQNDQAYIALKKEAMQNPFEDFSPERYEERIKKSEDFWKSK